MQAMTSKALEEKMFVAAHKMEKFISLLSSAVLLQQEKPVTWKTGLFL